VDPSALVDADSDADTEEASAALVDADADADTEEREKADCAVAPCDRPEPACCYNSEMDSGDDGGDDSGDDDSNDGSGDGEQKYLTISQKCQTWATSAAPVNNEVDHGTTVASSDTVELLNEGYKDYLEGESALDLNLSSELTNAHISCAAPGVLVRVDGGTSMSSIAVVLMHWTTGSASRLRVRAFHFTRCRPPD
jgi:hypothetical protein